MVDRVPDEVTRFIRKNIHGLSQLELLLYLHNDPTKEVTQETIVREQSMAPDQVAGLLHDLCSRGLAVATDREGVRSYRYEPKTRQLARQVDALAEIYPKYRHRIIHLIFSKPSESVTNFAEAFRLRKDENDG